MKGENWIMIANSRQILYSADSLGHEKYSSLKKHYEQMPLEPQQSYPSVRVSKWYMYLFISSNSDK